MQNAALQVHTVYPARRAAGFWRAFAPLALYTALALMLADVFGTPLDALALLGGAAVLLALAFAPPRAARIAGAAAVLGAALSLVLLPAVRSGALLLANRLYASSEAVNAYAYGHFAVAEDPFALRAALMAAAVSGGALCALLFRRRAAIVALLVGAAFFEAYFGVTPEAWRNILLFAVLALLLLREDAISPNGATLLALLAVVALAAFLLAPRPNAVVEAYSERLRDELSIAASNALRPAPPETESVPARQESRQHEAPANIDEAGERGRQTFERQTESERELSLPHRIDYGRMILLLLAAAALLLVPFLPFLLLNRVKRLADERRAAFETADNAAAICAMFAHTMRWLRAAGLQTENRPFAQCAEAVGRLTSDEYAARYAEGAAIWQEAAYSEHAMSAQQRAAVRALLDDTETTIYGRAGRRMRLRLKYVECLCGG